MGVCMSTSSNLARGSVTPVLEAGERPSAQGTVVYPGGALPESVQHDSMQSDANKTSLLETRLQGLESMVMQLQQQLTNTVAENSEMKSKLKALQQQVQKDQKDSTSVDYGYGTAEKAACLSAVSARTSTLEAGLADVSQRLSRVEVGLTQVKDTQEGQRAAQEFAKQLQRAQQSGMVPYRVAPASTDERAPSNVGLWMGDAGPAKMLPPPAPFPKLKPARDRKRLDAAGNPSGGARSQPSSGREARAGGAPVAVRRAGGGAGSGSASAAPLGAAPRSNDIGPAAGRRSRPLDGQPATSTPAAPATSLAFAEARAGSVSPPTGLAAAGSAPLVMVQPAQSSGFSPAGSSSQQYRMQSTAAQPAGFVLSLEAGLGGDKAGFGERTEGRSEPWMGYGANSKSGNRTDKSEWMGVDRQDRASVGDRQDRAAPSGPRLSSPGVGIGRLGTRPDFLERGQSDSCPEQAAPSRPAATEQPRNEKLDSFGERAAAGVLAAALGMVGEMQSAGGGHDRGGGSGGWQPERGWEQMGPQAGNAIPSFINSPLGSEPSSLSSPLVDGPRGSGHQPEFAPSNGDLNSVQRYGNVMPSDLLLAHHMKGGGGPRLVQGLNGSGQARQQVW